MELPGKHWVICYGLAACSGEVAALLKHLHEYPVNYLLSWWSGFEKFIVQIQCSNSLKSWELRLFERMSNSQKFHHQNTPDQKIPSGLQVCLGLFCKKNATV